MSAHNIANLDTDGFRRDQPVQASVASGGVSSSVTRFPESGSSLETDVVGLLQAKYSFLANLSVFRTSEQMMESLMDVAG